jgi:hypothetical protein
MAIAQCPHLVDVSHGRHLPPSWTTLYELSRPRRGRPRLDWRFRFGTANDPRPNELPKATGELRRGTQMELRGDAHGWQGQLRQSQIGTAEQRRYALWRQNLTLVRSNLTVLEVRPAHRPEKSVSTEGLLPPTWLPSSQYPA